MTTTTAPTQDLSAHQNLVFSSVFPIPSLAHSTPTPLATPNLGFTAPGQSFGGSSITSSQQSQPSLAAQQEVKRNIAWSTATRFLSLRPDGGHARSPERYRATRREQEITESLQYLLIGDGAPGPGNEEESLNDWYTNEVQSHYLSYVQPALQPLWDPNTPREQVFDVLEEAVDKLRQSQTMYFQPLKDHILPIIATAGPASSKRQHALAANRAEEVVLKFRNDLHATVMHSVPSSQGYSLPPRKVFVTKLAWTIFDTGCRLFRLNTYDSTSSKAPHNDPRALRTRLTTLLQGLQEVGLGGDQAEIGIANAMHQLLDAFISSQYMKVDWYGGASVVQKLRVWISDGFAQFAKELLGCLVKPGDGSGVPQVGAEEIKQWQGMAVERLGRNRIADLFDYIVQWPASLGAILDVKEYIVTPAARSYLSLDFSQQLSRRLLHAGATTTHILDIYIYVIRAFNELDPKGVLLDRVARPIRRYLKDRDDTARTIVASLLADVVDDDGKRINPGGDISAEIASEMLNPISPHLHEHDQDLDWGNMLWTPDPIDAGPDYKRSKSEDVIAYLLTLFDREEFITQLKTILGAHLLRNEDSDFEKEIRLLEFFKLRLGDDKLQACEVMLHDVLESKRMNAGIHKQPQYHRPERPRNGGAPVQPDLKAQILSSFFWPPLREEAFHVPPPVQALQERYEQGFEAVKAMRKLQWLHALGRAVVELELEDRTLELECTTWQASVIYAFNDAPASASLHVARLEEMLEMDESLVRNALTFWVGKLVLHETTPDTYAVVRRLDEQSRAEKQEAAAAAAEAEAIAAVSAVKTQEDLLIENLPVYTQFVQAMLIAQGKMDANKILMMLKMALPGGFAGGVEEVKMVLGRMEAEGRVVGQGGGVWAVKKE